MAKRARSVDVDRMAELYRQGRTTPEIGVALGVPPRTVYRRLVAGGVAMRPSGGRRKVSDEELLRLRAEGLLWREVAARVGMATNTVHTRWRRLRDSGHLDPMPPSTPEDSAVAMYLGGMTLTQVAARLGSNRWRISKRIRAAGVPTRAPRGRMPVDDMEIMRLRSEGLVWRQIGAQVGMTPRGARARFDRLRARTGYEDPMPPRD